MRQVEMGSARASGSVIPMRTRGYPTVLKVEGNGKAAEPELPEQVATALLNKGVGLRVRQRARCDSPYLALGKKVGCA